MVNLMETACRRNKRKKKPPKQGDPFLNAEIFIIDDNNSMVREHPARSAGCLCLTTCWVLFIRLLSNSAIWDQARRERLTFTAISRKVVGKNVLVTIPKGNIGYGQYTVSWHCSWHSQTYMHGPSCHSFKFLRRTMNSKLPTIPFGIVACTSSDNRSRNNCIHL